MTWCIMKGMVRLMIKMWNKAGRVFGNVCIVDRFLLIFLLTLFVYIIVHIFSGAAATQEGNTIDIIVRTSMAAIFGYFISSNFSERQNTLSAQSTDSADQSFEQVVPFRRCSKIQVTIVASIGLISLAVLFVTRFYQDFTPELSATISQLRDFVSACIGFLASCGKNISE